MSSNVKSSTVAIMTTCAIAFIIFVFCYLYFLQADLLALSQFAWSDGQTHYDRLVGAVLLTVVFLSASCFQAEQRTVLLSLLIFPCSLKE